MNNYEKSATRKGGVGQKGGWKTTLIENGGRASSDAAKPPQTRTDPPKVGQCGALAITHEPQIEQN